MHVSINGAQSLAQWFNVHEGSTNNCLCLYRSQHNFQLFQTVSLPPPVRHQTKGKNASVEEAPYFPSVIKLGSRCSATSRLRQKTNAFFIIASIIYKFDDTNALYNIKLPNTFVVRLIKTPFSVFLFAKSLCRGVAESFFLYAVLVPCHLSTVHPCLSISPLKKAGGMLNPTHQFLKTLQRDGM